MDRLQELHSLPRVLHLYPLLRSHLVNLHLNFSDLFMTGHKLPLMKIS